MNAPDPTPVIPTPTPDQQPTAPERVTGLEDPQDGVRRYIDDDRRRRRDKVARIGAWGAVQ